MEEIRIRTGRISDIAHILHHRRAMFAEMGGADESVLDRMQEASELYLREALVSGIYRAWLAETEAGRVVSGGGIAIVPWPGSPDFPGTRRGWILSVYTEPEFRRRGIARRIMETIVDWCRSEGFAHVSLHASHDGRLLYEKMGFRPTNEMRLYLK
ncbi:GCN5-related N-acetyltransferase [Candidatus Sulfopaludibacter sp. SbA4]|nr:GCN5-related N-acetyltransferase [Candidatus Sulfopaludibacter sp. SbA4]